jgi:putative transposase
MRAEHQASIEELEAIPDHIHLLVNVDPQFGIHRLVWLIKGQLSRFLRQGYPILKRNLPGLWTNLYAGKTPSGAPLSRIKQESEQQTHVYQGISVSVVSDKEAGDDAQPVAWLVLRDL